MFFKHKNDLVLCGGWSLDDISVNDGIRIKIERYLDNNSVEVELSYVKSIFMNVSVD